MRFTCRALSDVQICNILYITTVAVCSASLDFIHNYHQYLLQKVSRNQRHALFLSNTACLTSIYSVLHTAGKITRYRYCWNQFLLSSNHSIIALWIQLMIACMYVFADVLQRTEAYDSTSDRRSKEGCFTTSSSDRKIAAFQCNKGGLNLCLWIYILTLPDLVLIVPYPQYQLFPYMDDPIPPIIPPPYSPPLPYIDEPPYDETP